MRYIKIDGTAVAVSVKSATEAKAAVKELLQKKSELKFECKELRRRQKALRPKRPSTRGRKQKTSTMSRAVDSLGGMIGGLFNHSTASPGGHSAREVAEIEREFRRLEEILHNIDGCIVQLKGKLLTHG